MPGILGMVAGPLISGAANYFANKWGQQEQISQQERLMAMQLSGAKEMAQYQHDLQKKMWEETNIPAQVAMYKKAGMNPALMYGMGGGGGTTTGSGTGAMPSISQAENPGKNIAGAMDMAMMLTQKKLMDAQTEKTKADAEKAKADTAKTAGVDTKKTQAETDNLLQGYDNLRQQHELNKLKITYDNIINYEQQASQPNRLKYIETNTEQALQQLKILQQTANLNQATYQDKIKQIKAEAIGATIHNELMRAGINKTETEIRAQKQQIQNWYEQNLREWDKMNFEERKIKVQELLQEWQTDPGKHAVDQLTNALSPILFFAK